ncbi:uncharacterized protein LOC126602977 [Malus sylvestris]|uniref:uncharacterized protein LOC126602977 n=1 Tax=Malus sylvestris TaxID=3752 RepID=UPI0010AA2563|nr:uncharacterized protein LOC108169898 [Malus domestica]XP_050125724.1 uncharacterized protein LOC126602977 [Malus sylvestris]
MDFRDQVWSGMRGEVVTFSQTDRGRGRQSDREKGRGRSGDLSTIATDPRFHEWERGYSQRKVWGPSGFEGEGYGSGPGVWVCPFGLFATSLSDLLRLSDDGNTKSFTPQSMMLNEDYGVEYQDEETRNEFWLLIIAALLLGIVSAFSSTSTILYVHLKVIGI